MTDRDDNGWNSGREPATDDVAFVSSTNTADTPTPDELRATLRTFRGAGYPESPPPPPNEHWLNPGLGFGYPALQDPDLVADGVGYLIAPRHLRYVAAGAAKKPDRANGGTPRPSVVEEGGVFGGFGGYWTTSEYREMRRRQRERFANVVFILSRVGIWAAWAGFWAVFAALVR